jgi:segregation and condensation protein B
MTEPDETDVADQERDQSSGDLGRAYGALLAQLPWELDVNQSVSADPVPPPEPGPVPDRRAAAPAAEAPVETAAPPPVERIVEALLFVGGTPLTPERAGETVRGLTPEQFRQVVEELNRTYRQQGRPYRVQVQERGYVLALQSRYRPVLEKLYGTTRTARLSAAAIDVLALVAYRQPATKQEVDSLRGADCGALLRQLVRRGLVAVVHRGEAAQREVSYGTTARFLELFRLRSLDDLPQTQDLQRL